MTIAAIRQFLKHPDCIIFVGSGISTWSELPSWSGLIQQLADFLDDEGQSSELVRREIRSGDLLQAASFGVSKLTAASFGIFIRRAMRHGATNPHAIHKAIVELGPTGFITTNYDTLIEQALGKWRTDAFFPAPVTNKHLVELADTVRARSSHFIFKPHGDINDVSSIILTREQYRTLMPGGERQGALETLKMLLMTRPVLYVGFGLRDPDFIYLRDLLLNIYQGAVRDHWAIMPSTSEEEVDYWRNQYGIKLLGYKIHERADGSNDHSELLSLLQALAPPTAATATTAEENGGEPSEAERILAITRYTSGLVRRLNPTSSPIAVRISETKKSRSGRMHLGLYENWTTSRFLTDGPQPAYLIGLPGSGKSFALRLATMQLAINLQQACMFDTLAVSPMTLPVLLDLKLYKGNLREQIAAELPAGFTLDQLRGDLHLKIFLDAFNEMPSEYLENGALFKSLDEIKSEIGNFSYAITSRTSDGLPNRLGDSQFYEIDRFEQHHVDAVLSENAIVLSGRFAEDVRHLLSRPFFLQLFAKRLVEVSANATPRDLLASFVTKLQRAFSDRFDTDLSLLPIFSKVSYRAIEAESEAFPLAWLSDLIATQVPDGAPFSAGDIVNWLIAREVLIPYTGRRASFVHQSITEYCASVELVKRSQADALSLRDTISSKKWDQCLFLALAQMEPAAAESVLAEIIKADLQFAINAVRYAEEGQSAAAARLLRELIRQAKNGDAQKFFGIWLKNLPVGAEHVSLLEELLTFGNSIAAESVKLIVEVLGIEYKSQLLDLLESHADDFNFAVNGIAVALGPLIDEFDINRVLSIANVWLIKNGDHDSCYSISEVLGFFDTEILIRTSRSSKDIMSPGMARLIAGGLSNRGDKRSFDFLADLLISYPRETTSSFSLSLARHQSDADAAYYDCLDHRHIQAIWSTRFSDGLWDNALSEVCKLRPDLNPHVENIAKSCSGFEAIALRYCLNIDDHTMPPELVELLEFNDEELKDQPFEILPLSEFDWHDREIFFVNNLTRQLPRLRKSLLTNFVESHLKPNSVDLVTMQPAIELVEVALGGADEWWSQHQLGRVVAHLGNAEVGTFCLHALVHGSKRVRDWVKASYLGSPQVLTSDALDDDMIAALLADLNVPNRISEHWYNPMGNIATDRFVQERLIPLVEGASPAFLQNLKVVLKAAGDRHGKRYLLPN